MSRQYISLTTQLTSTQISHLSSFNSTPIDSVPVDPNEGSQLNFTRTCRTASAGPLMFTHPDQQAPSIDGIISNGKGDLELIKEDFVRGAIGELPHGGKPEHVLGCESQEAEWGEERRERLRRGEEGVSQRKRRGGGAEWS